MSALTRYPAPRTTCPRTLAASPWFSPGGWFQREDGSWCRVYVRRGRRARSARRAVIRNVGGWWRWEVEQFELRNRASRRICARGVNGYLFWQAARGFADLSARTAD